MNWNLLDAEEQVDRGASEDGGRCEEGLLSRTLGEEESADFLLTAIADRLLLSRQRSMIWMATFNLDAKRPAEKRACRRSVPLRAARAATVRCRRKVPCLYIAVVACCSCSVS
jgi:hypothetical protein